MVWATYLQSACPVPSMFACLPQAAIHFLLQLMTALRKEIDNAKKQRNKATLSTYSLNCNTFPSCSPVCQYTSNKININHSLDYQEKARNPIICVFMHTTTRNSALRKNLANLIVIYNNQVVCLACHVFLTFSVMFLLCFMSRFMLHFCYILCVFGMSHFCNMHTTNIKKVRVV